MLSGPKLVVLKECGYHMSVCVYIYIYIYIYIHTYTYIHIKSKKTTVLVTSAFW